LSRGPLTATVALLALALVPAAAPAATLTPNTTVDEDGVGPDCSFREAVESASFDADLGGCTHTSTYGADTVLLPGGTYRLTTDGVNILDTTNLTTIIRAGAAPVTVEQTTLDKVVKINGDTVMRGLTITGGNLPANAIGGGIGVGNSASLTLTDSTVTGNSVGDAATGGDGGGIGITNGSSMTLVNVTVSGNSASDSGGGISDNGGTVSVSLTNVTVTGNHADTNNDGGEGGGVRATGLAFTLRDSIVAGNTAPATNQAPDCSLDQANTVSHDHNLIGDTSDCTWISAAGDITGMPAKLGSLAANGGPTFTHALLAGSPAINAGAGCPAADQRGVPRSLGGVCDLGTYELVRCRGAVVNRVGTAGKNRLKGTKKADGILGLGGNDRLIGLGGNDGLCGGTGKDTLRGGGGRDRLAGQAGRDRLLGGPGLDRCSGGPGRDVQLSC
jgi:CSLREA domain-containing protein